MAKRIYIELSDLDYKVSQTIADKKPIWIKIINNKRTTVQINSLRELCEYFVSTALNQYEDIAKDVLGMKDGQPKNLDEVISAGTLDHKKRRWFKQGLELIGREELEKLHGIDTINKYCGERETKTTIKKGKK